MIELLLREAVFTVWVAGIIGSWRMLRLVVLPFAVDRCPWAQGIDGP